MDDDLDLDLIDQLLAQDRNSPSKQTQNILIPKENSEKSNNSPFKMPEKLIASTSQLIQASFNSFQASSVFPPDTHPINVVSDHPVYFEVPDEPKNSEILDRNPSISQNAKHRQYESPYNSQDKISKKQFISSQSTQASYSSGKKSYNRHTSYFYSQFDNCESSQGSQNFEDSREESSSRTSRRRVEYKEDEKIAVVFIALLKEDRFYVGFNPDSDNVEDDLEVDSQFLPNWVKLFPLEQIIHAEPPIRNYQYDCKNLALALMKKVGYFRVRGGLNWKSAKDPVPQELNSYENRTYESIVDKILSKANLARLIMEPGKCSCGQHKNYACELKNFVEASVTRCLFCSEIGHLSTDCKTKLFTNRLIDEFHEKFSWLKYDKFKDLSDYEDLWSIEGNLYVLELKNYCFYVGHTQKPVEKRFKEHCSSYKSSQWCQENRPIRVVYSEPGNLMDEDWLTLEVMRKFGWWRVRGGRWCALEAEVPEPLCNPFCLDMIDTDYKFMNEFKAEGNLEKACHCKKVDWAHRKFACPMEFEYKNPLRAGEDECRFCGKEGHSSARCYKRNDMLRDLNSLYKKLERNEKKELVMKHLANESDLFMGLTPAEIENSINYLVKFYGNERKSPKKTEGYKYRSALYERINR